MSAPTERRSAKQMHADLRAADYDKTMFSSRGIVLSVRAMCTSTRGPVKMESALSWNVWDADL